MTPTTCRSGFFFYSSIFMLCIVRFYKEHKKMKLIYMILTYLRGFRDVLHILNEWKILSLSLKHSEKKFHNKQKTHTQSFLFYEFYSWWFKLHKFSLPSSIHHKLSYVLKKKKERKKGMRKKQQRVKNEIPLAPQIVKFIIINLGERFVGIKNDNLLPLSQSLSFSVLFM